MENTNTDTNSRSFLLRWLRNQGILIDRIEDIGKGTALCALFKKYDSDFPPYKKEPWNENDYLHNLKLVQLYLEAKGGKIKLPIERMIKLRLQDNLESTQRIYKYACTAFCEHNSKDVPAEIKEVGKSSAHLGVLKNERDFYFKKLLEIERVLRESEEKPENMSDLKSTIFGILYRQ